MANAAAFSGASVTNLGPSKDGFLTPVVDEEGAPFWEAAARGELTVQTCTDCGRRRHPPRPMCPHCRSTGREWRPVSGRATVWSWCVPHPPLLPAYASVAPYNVVVVAIDEDPSIRFVGNLVEPDGGRLDAVDPATITVGEPVTVAWHRLERADGSSVVIPRWTRAAPG